MKKKNLVMILVFALAIFSLVGCNQDAGQDSPTEAENVTEAEEIVETEEVTEEETEEVVEDGSEEAEAEAVTGEGLVLYRGYSSPNRPDEFASVVVAVQDNVILDASIDEYMYSDTLEGVPNSDGKFGEGSVEGQSLVSKLENDEVYSKNMEEIAGSTLTVAENYAGIESFVRGMTVEEVQELVDGAEDGQAIDAVSEATFVNTKSYLQSIVDVVNNGDIVSEFPAIEDTAGLELKRGVEAPHGDQAFADVVVAVNGDTILGASIDEFQYVEGGESIFGSNEEFGEVFANPDAPLISKSMNDEMYSSLMKDIANASNTLLGNYQAIQAYTAGKTVSEVEETIADSTPGEPVDAVSEATFVDTVGYLQAIVDVAKK